VVLTGFYLYESITSEINLGYRTELIFFKNTHGNKNLTITQSVSLPISHSNLQQLHNTNFGTGKFSDSFLQP